MAGRWANAALKDQTWPQDLRLNGTAVPSEFERRLTTGGLTRSVSQASVLQLSMQNGDRYVTEHWASNPFQAPAPHWVYGIPAGFTLVQLAKQGDVVTLTSEDAVINRLRGFKGPLAQAAGTVTFVDFARQICRRAGVPFIADTRAAKLNSPVSVGGPNTTGSGGGATAEDGQAEDYWAALTRMAGDRGWYCFSDGTSVIYGPGYWLLAWGGSPAMTISEAANPRGGTLVDNIDGSMDTGKPVSQLTVTSRASEWAADPGGWVRIAPGLGPFSGNWVCTDIARQSLASDAISVTLAAPTPVKPEPAASGTTTATTSTTTAATPTATRPADPNANRPGYVQAEDGSWVPKNYYS